MERTAIWLKNPPLSEQKWAVTVRYTTVEIYGLPKHLTLTPEEAEVLGKQIVTASKEARKRRTNYERGQRRRFNGGEVK
jgi:hypothetical protein